MTYDEAADRCKQSIRDSTRQSKREWMVLCMTALLNKVKANPYRTPDGCVHCGFCGELIVKGFVADREYCDNCGKAINWTGLSLGGSE